MYKNYSFDYIIGKENNVKGEWKSERDRFEQDWKWCVDVVFLNKIQIKFVFVMGYR